MVQETCKGITQYTYIILFSLLQKWMNEHTYNKVNKLEVSIVLHDRNLLVFCFLLLLYLCNCIRASELALDCVFEFYHKCAQFLFHQLWIFVVHIRQYHLIQYICEHIYCSLLNKYNVVKYYLWKASEIYLWAYLINV